MEFMIDKNDVLENGIAIVGISCRFPGARSLREYWDNLCRGKVSVTFPDRETLAEAGVSRELLEDPTCGPSTASAIRKCLTPRSSATPGARRKK